jgi:hypothetical protein
MAIEVVFEKRINNATVYREVDVDQRRQIYLLTSLAVLFRLGRPALRMAAIPLDTAGL